MLSRGNLKRTLATVVAGVLIGGGVTMVSPAGAEVSQLATTNWNKIWKKKLQKKADARYYTKTATSSLLGNYYTKAQADIALGGYYTKAQSDAAYAPKAQTYTKAESDAAYAPKTQSYTKAESDAKYAPAPALIRGVYVDQGGDGDGLLTADLAFGVTLAAAPITHYIPSGAVLPAGCSGTVGNPNAAAGHLCVFSSGSSNVSPPYVFNPTNVSAGSTTFGASIVANSAGVGTFWIRGSWALRPAALGTPPAPAAAQGINEVVPAEGLLK